MEHPFIKAFKEDDLKFLFIDHEDEVQIGPFTFKKDLPIPIGVETNDLAHENWLDIPFKAREELPKGYEEAPDDANVQELCTALLEGHLGQQSSDYRILADHVGRSLLLIITYDKNNINFNEYEDIFLNSSEVKNLFDRLLRSAKEFYNQAMFVSEDEQALALRMTLISRTLFYGAHLLSPTTPGILYELGTLTFDLGSRFLIEDAKWKVNLYIESAEFLELALASEDVQVATPAFYLLGLIREHLGNKDGAMSVYQKFLDKVPENMFKDIRFIVKDRINNL